MKILRKQLVLPLVFTVIFFSGLVFYASKQKQSSSNVALPTPAASGNAIKEEAKDGVYTNYTYGFKMTYPKELFNKVDRPWDSITDKWFYVEGQRVPRLVVGKHDQPANIEHYQGFYEKCRNANPSEILDKTVKNGTVIKLYNTDIACVTYTTPEGLEDGEPSYGYGAIIKSPTNDLFYITLGEFDPSKLQSLKDEFDTTVKSFAFINIE